MAEFLHPASLKLAAGIFVGSFLCEIRALSVWKITLSVDGIPKALMSFCYYR